MLRIIFFLSSLTILSNVQLSSQQTNDTQIWNMKYHIITGNGVNIRDANSAKSLVIDQLNTGHLVQVMGVEGMHRVDGVERPFYRILYTKDNYTRIGYVWSGLTSNRYHQSGSSLVFLKEDAPIDTLGSPSYSIKYHDGYRTTQLGKLPLGGNEIIDLRSFHPRHLTGIRHIIEIKIKAVGDICENHHTLYTFMLTNEQQGVSLPAMTSYEAIDGNAVHRYLYPHEPGGEHEKVIAVSIKYGLETPSYDLRKLSYFVLDEDHMKEYQFGVQ